MTFFHHLRYEHPEGLPEIFGGLLIFCALPRESCSSNSKYSDSNCENFFLCPRIVKLDFDKKDFVTKHDLQKVWFFQKKRFFLFLFSN